MQLLAKLNVVLEQRYWRDIPFEDTVLAVNKSTGKCSFGVKGVHCLVRGDDVVPMSDDTGYYFYIVKVEPCLDN
jgi:hypothetical protein